jgi:hypothetical protein
MSEVRDNADLIFGLFLGAVVGLLFGLAIHLLTSGISM